VNSREDNVIKINHFTPVDSDLIWAGPLKYFEGLKLKNEAELEYQTRFLEVDKILFTFTFFKKFRFLWRKD